MLPCSVYDRVRSWFKKRCGRFLIESTVACRYIVAMFTNQSGASHLGGRGGRLTDVQRGSALQDHIRALRRVMQTASFYPHDVTAIRKEETHISLVFLTGSRVYKIKKPVNLGFLDFSTLALREHYCRQEMALNQRLSRDVYQGVVGITVDDGDYRLDGPGTVVEYAVVMRELPFDETLKRRLRSGTLAADALDRLARMLVAFYEDAATGGEIDTMGTLSVIAQNCEDNFEQMAESAGSVFDAQAYGVVKQSTRAFLEQHGDRFEARIRAHKIRDAHGDLRAGHIYFVADQIQIIDCIEFNERFRCVDIVGDLAFLCMDLDYLGYPEAARAFFHSYLTHSNDLSAFNLLAFYKCYRAMVRAKVNCLRLKQPDLAEDERVDLIGQTVRYTELARQYASVFGCPTVWVVCGLIATGKSTVADTLAKALGVSQHNSDRIRKTLSGSDGPVPFGKGPYTREATGLIYGKLMLHAQEAVAQGCSIVLDATYGRREQRDAVRRLADHFRARIVFVECTCRETLIRERLEAREDLSRSVSDARLEHLAPIKARYEAPDEIDAAHLIRVDTEQALDDNIHTILARFA